MKNNLVNVSFTPEEARFLLEVVSRLPNSTNSFALYAKLHSIVSELDQSTKNDDDTESSSELTSG